MDAIEQKTSEKKGKGCAPTVIRYTVYVNINTHTHIYIFIYIFLCVCVCFYDLAMPICIILGPLNWTRPDLIRIEGDRGWHCPRAPQGAAAEADSPQSRAPVPAERPPAQPPKGVSTEDGTAGCRTPQPPLPSERERRGSLGRGVQLGPGMTTSQHRKITIR